MSIYQPMMTSLLSRRIFLFVVALFLFAGAFQPALADAPNPCYDISGAGKAVNVSGVPNSGIVHFDDPMAPLSEYQACARKVGNTIRLEGWSWNDNLGWVSLFCDSTGLNRGLPCGNDGITYGVTIDSNGNFNGHAWGDNTGWIRFNNGSYSQVKVETQDPACQGFVYGFTPPPGKSCTHGANMNEGKKLTHAWSDNVGWIDFDSIFLPWYSLQQVFTDSNILVQISPDPSVQLKAAGTPVANGSDYYALSVIITGPDGQPLDTQRYQTSIQPLWIDTVKKNQTDSSIQLDNASCNHNFDQPGSSGAVLKPCVPEDFAIRAPGTYGANIKSYAPTSNMNGLDENDDGVVDFSYEEFVTPSAMTSPQANNLALTGVQVSIFDTQTSTCVYPDASCAPKLLLPTYAGSDPSFKFMPQTEIVTFNGNPTTKSINFTVGPAYPFAVQMTGPGTIDLQAGVEPNPAYQNVLGFVFDTGASGLVWGQDTGILANVNKNLTQVLAGVVQNPTKSAPQYVSGLYIWSKVTEPSGIQYYSNKLPRVRDAFAVQPVAILRGNVYARGVATSTTAIQPIRSIGDISTNIVRDTFYKNVSKIIAGSPQPVKADTTLVADSNGGFKESADVFNGSSGTTKPAESTGNITPIMPWKVDGVDKGARVYYARGDVHLGLYDNANLTKALNWDGERTIIVIGGSVYIDNNLLKAPGASTKPKLGIIVLKDLAKPNPLQGNVYIGKHVTNLQGVNIAAPDGFIFPYDSKYYNAFPDQIDAATGEPAYFEGNESMSIEGSLKAQLYIEGSIASQNTIGGSLQNPPILGNGKIANSGDGNIDRYRARLYDLNFLRYYTGVLRRDPQGNVVHADGSPIASESDLRIFKPGTSLPWSKYEIINGQSGDLIPPTDPTSGLSGALAALGLNPQLDLGSVYIYFDPPTPGLPGFSKQEELDMKQLGR